MPTIRLTTVEGNTEAELKAFMDGVTELAERVLKAKRDAVIVHVEVLPAHRYMRAGQTIAEHRGLKA